MTPRRVCAGRVTFLGQVQNLPKGEKMEELGPALEEWLSKKRQYEEFTDKEGNNCRVADDSLMAAMFELMPRSLEETVTFKADDYGASLCTLSSSLLSAIFWHPSGCGMSPCLSGRWARGPLLGWNLFWRNSPWTYSDAGRGKPCVASPPALSGASSGSPLCFR